MRSWMAEYERKITTAEKAVRVVKSGDRVVLSHACGEPRVLPGELKWTFWGRFARTPWGQQFSGVGGQVDFVRGAKASEGGKAITALPSTARGDISRIVPVLKTGAAVTTSRNDVDYVVTDMGVAALSGKTYRERMKAIIQVAHPKFQEELAKKAFEIYNVRV